MRARQIFQALSWTPPALLGITTWYVKQYEGWGAWAAAPMFLLPIGFSALMGLVGAVLWTGAWRRGDSAPGLLLATLLAGSVGLWFLAKVIFAELARSL